MLMRFVVPNIWRICLWEQRVRAFLSRGKTGELGVENFHLKSMAIAITMKQTKKCYCLGIRNVRIEWNIS